MAAEECLFCKMVTGQIPVTKIYEDQVVLAFLDIGPISSGHTLVIPKQHFEKVHECPAQLFAQFAERLGEIAKAVSDAMQSDGYNVLCNNGRAAGQVIDHLHFHIIPRKTNDGVFDRWPSFKYPEGKAQSIADEIKKKLQG